MKHEPLDTVVLVRDVPEHGLRAGDLGAVVETYPPDALEVEFVTASGRTTALVRLKAAEVRAIADTDLVALNTSAPMSASHQKGSASLTERRNKHGTAPNLLACCIHDASL